MKHWKQYALDEGPTTNISFALRSRLWYWIEQTRGNKSRSQFVREILTEVMKDA